MRKLYLPSLIASFAVGAVIWFMIASRANEGRKRRLEPSGPVTSTTVSSLEPPLPGTQGGDAKSSAQQSDGESNLNSTGGAQLHGKVTDEDGGPLAQAKVYVLLSGDLLSDGWERVRLFRERILGRAAPPSPKVVSEATTGLDGLYSIPIASIAPGTYEVFARHLEHAPRSEAWIWTPESTEINFRLGDSDSITGVVLDPDHQAVAGSMVEAYLEEEGEWWSSFQLRGAREKVLADRTETDAQGKFRLWVTAGRFQLTASAKGYSRKTQSGVMAGASDVEIVLQPSRTISGRVLNPASEPLPQARVSLFRSRGRDPMASGSGRDPISGNNPNPSPRVLKLVSSPDALAESDDAGRFEFESLGSGRYVVFAEKGGFVPDQAEGDLGSNHETLTFDLTLEPGKVIAGSVTDAAGKPVPRAFVLVGQENSAEDFRPSRGSRGGEAIQASSRQTAAPPASEEKASKVPKAISPFHAAGAAETDDSGHFRLDTLKAGAYSLSVQSDDFLTYRQDGLELKESLEVDAVLRPGIRLEGKVLSHSAGEPISGAKIRARVNGDEKRETVSDAEGRYKIAGLVSTRMEAVEVEAAGFSVLVVEGLEVLPEPEVQARDFQLDASAILSGLVTESGGSPVPNARVSVAPLLEAGKEGGRSFYQARRLRAMQLAQRRTDAEGKFSISQVNAGSSLQVSIDHPDFKPFKSEPFSVKPGEQLQDLHFALEAGGRLEVFVLSPEGAKLPGVRVLVSSQGPANALDSRSAQAVGAPESSSDGSNPVASREGEAARRLRELARLRRGASRTTGADGKALFSGLEDGAALVSLAVKGCQPFSASVPVLSDQTFSLTARLSPENTLTGILQDRSGSPVEGARVEAMAKSPDASRPRSFSEAKTDDSGSFRLIGLGEGPYPVRFRKEGFAELTLPGVEVNTQIHPVLQRLGGISGRVLVAETGQPVPRFNLRLKEDRESGSSRDPQAISDPDGAFALANVPPGNYLIQVTGEDLWGAEARITVEDGLVTDGVEVRLVEGLSVIGVVTEKVTSAPVGGAEIFLLPLKDSSESSDGAPKREREEKRRAEREQLLAGRRAGAPAGEKADPEAVLAELLLKAASRGGNVLSVTDEAGGFQLTEVPPGRYVLVVSNEAFVPARQNIVIGEDRMARSVRIALEKGESLTGSLSFPDNSSAAGVTVSLRDSNGFVKHVQADERGRYLVQGLLGGTYWFSVRTGPDAKSGPYQVKIGPGSNRLDYQIGSNPIGSNPR